MGERAAYKVSEGGKSLFMIRKQWYIGSRHAEIENLIREIAEKLMTDRFCGSIGKIKIGDGSIALRDDLGIGRMSVALMMSLSSPPFDEIVESNDLNCDINDHGIFEIEMITWNKWAVNRYPVTWDDATKKDVLGAKKHLAAFLFESGKTLDKGMSVKWAVPDDWEYKDE
jgi:hypothetical protein